MNNIRLITVLSCLILLLLTSCSQKMEYNYAAGSVLYLNTSDSSNYSFAIKPSSLIEDTLKINVRIMGSPVGVDRHVKMGLNKTLTTAKEGNPSDGGHFKVLGCVIPADSIWGAVKIAIYRQPDLKNNNYIIAVDLLSNDDFKVNMGDRYSKFKVLINDKLTIPSNWNSYLKQYFGAPSLAKYQFIIDTLGIAVFPSYGVGSYEKGEMYFFKDKLITSLFEYNKIHGDLIDENGNKVSFN